MYILFLYPDNTIAVQGILMDKEGLEMGHGCSSCGGCAAPKKPAAPAKKATKKPVKK